MKRPSCLLSFVCRYACLLAGLTFSLLSPAADEIEPSHPSTSVTVALLDTMVNPFDAFMLKETVEALKNKLPDYDIRTTIITAAEADEQIKAFKPDFIFAPATFGALSGIETVRIATRKTHLAKTAEKSVGAAVIVKADSSFKTLKDLREACIFTGLPSALDGWLAVQAKALHAGIRENEFEHLTHRNNPYPDVISALYSGAADAAVLPACLLESLKDKRLADTQGLRVIDDQSTAGGALACQYSTALYPDISLLALSQAPEHVVRDVTIAILSLKNTAGSEWLTNVSHAAVNTLLKDLKMGPYAYLRDMSLQAIYLRHQTEFWLAAIVLLLIVFNEIRLRLMLRRRTEELTSVMHERERVRTEAASTRLQLAEFERRSIVQQMSSMIAHEINAPVGSIRTWVALARLKTPITAFKDEHFNVKNELDATLNHVDHEADRIADIVSRVRGYARQEAQPPVVCDLVVILGKALTAYHAEEKAADHTAIVFESATGHAFVMGQPLELEILFLNLIRNASTAMHKAQSENKLNEEASVSVKLLPNPSSPSGSWRIEVENPGAIVSEDDFLRLTERGASVTGSSSNYSGLGLGLTICRGIADRHGASLTFEKRDNGGIRAIVTVDAVDLKE